MSNREHSTSPSSINATENIQTVKRDFVGIWIPKEVWLSEHLSASEKCLWAEIRSLHNEERGGCFASNEYLQNFLGTSERQLQRITANLKKHGFLQQVSFDGRSRVLKAVIPEKNFQVIKDEEDEELAEQTRQKCHPTDDKNVTPLPYILDSSLDNSIIDSGKQGAKGDAPRPSGRSATQSFYKIIVNPHLEEAGFDPVKFQIGLTESNWQTLIKEYTPEKIIRCAQALSAKFAQDPAYRRKNKSPYMALRKFLENEDKFQKQNSFQKPTTAAFVKTGNKGDVSFFPKSALEDD